MKRGIIGLLCLVSFGCATSSKTTAVSNVRKAVDFYPAKKDYAWSYVVTNHQPPTPPVFLTVRVVEANETSFVVDTVKERLLYDLRPDGIFKPGSNYYMIKDPVKAGNGWRMANTPGGVRIEQTGLSVTVPAGTFQDCILVIEEVMDAQRSEWTYAPGVGPVKMRVVSLKRGKEELMVSGELKSYRLGPPPE